ncbi:hypothetical protein SKAU_G00320150 [Synaphobranchus kaupii]|uniref:Solute carrier family 43 member 3 n=1 Tax=Synaphobranchus kaupii TaxID=118154 RepID=A0A9Q1ENK4_SYNKA|nr:hypothetical protein SKAU_G00320150 [Synaphobranchus kaupii]
MKMGSLCAPPFSSWRPAVSSTSSKLSSSCPRLTSPTPLPEDYTYGMSCYSQSNSMEQEGVELQKANGNVQKKRDIYTITSLSRDSFRHEPSQPSQSSAVNEPSLRSCVLSWAYLFNLLWISIGRFNFFFLPVILNVMINHLADGNLTLVSRYTNVFAVAQLCAVFGAPWNGLIIDRNKGKQRAPGETEKEADLRSSVLSLFITSLVCLLFCICASIPVLPLQYLTFILQVIGSVFLFSGNSSFISIAFPSHFYGMLTGLGYCLSGCLVLFHYPLMIVVTDVLQGNPVYVFIGMTLLTLLTFIHPLYIYLHCRRLSAHRPTPPKYCLHAITKPEVTANF